MESKQTEISEKTFSPEFQTESIEIGGNLVKRFRPLDFIENGIKQRVYTVKAYKGFVDTQWGKRAEWVINDDSDEYTLSSWAFVTKDKFKALDLVGKEIQLRAKDEKRVELLVLK